MIRMALLNLPDQMLKGDFHYRTLFEMRGCPA